MRAEMKAAIESYLWERVSAGEIPGASFAVVAPDGIVVMGAVGHAAKTPERVAASTDTIYDLASLTKPLVTSMLYLILRRRLGLNDEMRAWRVLPELDRLDKREITIRHLLTHTSGMPAWSPLYLNGSTISDYLLQLRELRPEHLPGSRVVYSCPGYIILGEILQRASATPLAQLARDAIIRPLGLSRTTFNPPEAWRDQVAPTEDSCHHERSLTAPRSDGYTGFREGVIQGQVHDQNAWVLGGVAGNSGLFSTVRECATMALEYMGAGGGLLGPDELRLAQEDQTVNLNEARSYAFRIATRGETAAGPDLPAESFGHNGFTGTSLWIDPAGSRAYVLLTNRVHPRVRESVDMQALRQGFHSAAAKP